MATALAVALVEGNAVLTLLLGIATAVLALFAYSPIADGRSNSEIAATLVISHETVKTYVSRILTLRAPGRMCTMAENSVVAAFDAAAGTYDQVGVDFFSPFGAELVRRAGVRAGERVLDVGCGRGAVLFPAARAVGPDGHVTGTDAAPSMVELTGADAARQGLRQVTVEVGDAQDPAFPPGSFDVVTAGLVLFFLPDPHAALRAYGRLLRPGGRVALSTFAAQEPDLGRALRAFASHVPGEAQRPPARDPMFGSAEATVAAVADAGFRDVTCTEFSVVSRFRDQEHWLAWCWSHGARAVLRQIPPDRLPAATAEAFAAMWGAPTSGADLSMTTTIRAVVGTAPDRTDGGDDESR